MIIKSAPALKIYMAVMRYARSRGLDYFNQRDRDIALRLYAAHAENNN